MLDQWLRTKSYQIFEPKFRAMIDGLPEYRAKIKNYRNHSYYSYRNFDVEGFGDIGNITDQARFYEYDDYQDRSTRVYDDQEITGLIASLAQAKKEETDWAVFFGSPETLAEDAVAALDVFWDWLGAANRWYPNDSYKVGNPMFIIPSRLRPLMLDAVISAVEKNPDLQQPAAEAFARLKGKEAAGPEKDCRIYGTMLKHFPDKLWEAGHSDIDNIKHDRQLASLQFLGSLTDAGLISESAWYKVGVRERGEPPNFEFLDSLRGRLIDHGQEVRVNIGRNRIYYNDATYFARRTLERFASDPGRNNQVAQAVLNKLAALKKDGVNSPVDFIALANTLAPIINHLSNEEAHLGKLSRSAENLPEAFMRMLYATRDFTADEEVKADQEYEDEVYADILSFSVSKDAKSHQTWFIGEKLRRLNEATTMMRYSYRGDAYRTGIHRWRKGAPRRIVHRR